jgi:glutamate formiminotransferase / formiminotetrahydrofolate cyclodeaminase
MPTALVECIPNFSEARRPEVVEAILESIRNVPQVNVLDRHSDLDHNRTVITFVGPPQAAEEAAYRAISRAAELIDLNTHTGQHPRIGATDVVPFVPLVETSMAECVELSRRLGKRVAAELNLPVYLYEESATRPERQNLENIRSGEYEILKKEIGSNPERIPDFGPRSLGSAGAVVIGARQPLIAFNVYLTTDNVSVAEKVARAIRYSSGGLRYVKAMGVKVHGLAQVSMNLTNFRKTPVGRVVEMIRREAATYGVAIHHSELVGLIPQAALTDAASWYLQMEGFKPEQVLENRLTNLPTPQPVSTSIELQTSFLDQLANGKATPGGGSASAFAGAMAAALAGMVARSTVNKAKYAGVKDHLWVLIEQAETLRADLTSLVDQDSLVFLNLMAANALPQETTEQQNQRRQAIENASFQAAEVPLRVCRAALQVLQLTLEAASSGNQNAIADAVNGGILAQACLNGSAINARMNLNGLNNKQQAVQPILDELASLEIKAGELTAKLYTVFKDRTGIQ